MRDSTRSAGQGAPPRHALVTGGGSGIGLACAERLAASGYVVTITGRRAPVLEQAADRLRSAGRVVRTFLTLRAAAPHMAAAGLGSFVAISSVNAERTSRFHAPYCATKAAVEMLVCCAADELGHAGIRVNAVRPGLAPTDLSATIIDDDEARADFLEQMPLRRLGSVDEIAAAVAFLCSPSASWITAACLPVDGGHHLRRGERFDSLMRRDHPAAPDWWGITHRPPGSHPSHPIS